MELVEIQLHLSLWLYSCTLHVGLIGELESLWPNFASVTLEHLYRKHLYCDVFLKATRITCVALLLAVLCIELILAEGYYITSSKPSSSSSYLFLITAVVLLLLALGATSPVFYRMLRIVCPCEGFSPFVATYYCTLIAYCLAGLSFIWSLKIPLAERVEQGTDFYRESFMVFALTFTTLVSQLGCLMLKHTVVCIIVVNSSCMYLIFLYFKDHSLIVLLFMGSACNVGMWWQRELSMRDSWRMASNIADWRLYNQVNRDREDEYV